MEVFLKSFAYNISPVSVPKKVSFGISMGEDNGYKIDTYFARGYDTLKKSEKYLKKIFPQGCEVLNYACSDAQETITIALMLGEKYPVKGYDISEKAEIKRGLGEYYISQDLKDSFILKPDNELSPDLIKLKNEFQKYFLIGKTPPSIMKDKKIIGKIYLVNKIPNLFFESIENSDIRRLSTVVSQRLIGAIMFRNAFWQLRKNNNVRQLIADIANNKDLFEIEKNIPTQKEYNKMIKDFEMIVKSANKKLEPNGIFILGDIHQEHIYIAPDNIASNQTIPLSQTEYGKKLINKAINEKNFSLARKLKLMDKINVLKESPLETIFQKNGFIKEFTDCLVGSNDIKITTVFKKIAHIL